LKIKKHEMTIFVTRRTNIGNWSNLVSAFKPGATTTNKIKVVISMD